MKSLEELKWEALDIQEVFPDIKRGRRLKTEDHIKGEMPYVSSSALNNGVDDYVSNKDRVRIFNDCLTIANSGSVGASFYHPYKFVASDHVTKLKNKDYNKYVYLFLATVTSRLSDKYSFNREINGNRINREKIYVPVDANGKPDFRFMEAYMRDLEQKILKPTIDKLCKQLIYNQMGGLRNCNLLNHKWKEFDFVDIFEIRKGFYNKKPPCYENGNIPFIGATDSNNGITGFSDYETIDANSKIGYGPNESIDRKIFPGNAICVTNNGSVGYAYYQPSEFTCTHDVNPLYLKNIALNRHLAMFLIACIEKQRVCFTYARKWRPKRMVHSKLMLPIDEAEQPDWSFMENFMKEVENDALNTTLSYFTDKQSITPPVKSSNELKYKEFDIQSIFNILPGKRLTKSNMVQGKRPFIGATDSFLNNGITEWVDNYNESLDKNCLGVNYNGSVGETFYHPYSCIFSDDVKRLHLKSSSASHYTMLFLKTAILQQKEKYAYGYKFNEKRMLKQIITLPATPDGSPDWDYMESYMRHHEAQHILSAIQHFQSRS